MSASRQNHLSFCSYYSSFRSTVRYRRGFAALQDKEVGGKCSECNITRGGRYRMYQKRSSQISSSGLWPSNLGMRINECNLIVVEWIHIVFTFTSSVTCYAPGDSWAIDKSVFIGTTATKLGQYTAETWSSARCRECDAHSEIKYLHMRNEEKCQQYSSLHSICNTWSYTQAASLCIQFTHFVREMYEMFIINYISFIQLWLKF
jgi:hypothetical protein